MESKNEYWNKEVCRLLEIGDSTLRKWCIELEKNGYKFERALKDSRAFTDDDLKALKSFKQLRKARKMTITQAAKMIVEQFQGKEESEGTVPIPMSENNQLPNSVEKLLLELLDRSNKQEKSIKLLSEKIDEQQQIIREFLNKKD